MKRFRLIQQGRRTHSVPAKNIIAQDFQADKLNQKWVCDTTFIPTRKGWLYLATVIDLYSRKVVGWSMSKKNDKKLVIGALQMAINRRKPKKGLLCHSDQGVQYASGDYKSILAKYKIIQSMSRKGCCWDNAVAESFFNITAKMKQEQLYLITLKYFTIGNEFINHWIIKPQMNLRN
jgi:transposase InsO family protein